MIADLKPYAEYKESGLPWLGQVPGHWGQRRMKFLFKERTQKGFPAEPLLAATQSKGVVRKEDYGSRTVTAMNGLENLKLVEIGDFVISLRSFQGGIEVSHARGIISPAYTVLFPRDDFDPRFFQACFKSSDFISGLTLFVTGIREGQNIDYERLSRAFMPLPPPDEQAAIVRFLDWSNGRLERAIRAKRKVIALLNEQKQAIIHRAATRGLDPSVPLKPSGIPWLGDIPQHWEVHQLRRLVRPGRRITYGIVQPGEPDPNGRFMIRGQDYSTGWVRPGAIFRVSPAVETPYSRSRLMAGDLLVTIVGAGVGNVAITPGWLDGANITQTTARVSVDPSKANPAYVGLVLQGPIGRRNVERYVKGAAQPGLNLEHLRIFLLPMAPISEQLSIVESISGELSSFDRASARLEREMDLLREYRTRLVADVVTGKLDVRGAAARLPDEAPLDTIEDYTHLSDETEPADEEAIVA